MPARRTTPKPDVATKVRAPKVRHTEQEKATVALERAQRRLERITSALTKAIAEVNTLTAEQVAAQALVTYLASHPALGTNTGGTEDDEEAPTA